MKLPGISAKIIRRSKAETPYGMKMARKNIRLSGSSGGNLGKASFCIIGKTAYIQQPIVMPVLQDMGLGSAAIRAAESNARRNGATKSEGRAYMKSAAILFMKRGYYPDKEFISAFNGRSGLGKNSRPSRERLIASIREVDIPKSTGLILRKRLA